jgi:hypothetical protein
VKAHPEKSDRVIAAELGINQSTVSRVRKRSTDAGASVEKRIGKDGKARKQPKPRSRPVEDKARAVMRDRVASGAPVKAREVAKAEGISHVMMEQAAAMERARVEVLAELNVDPETLAPSAKAKLEAVKLALTRKLNAEHAARMRGIDEEVRLRVVASGKEYIARMKVMEEKAWADEQHWRKMVNDHKPPFTPDQFKTILMCLHPDGERTTEKLSEAFRLFNGKRIQLSGKN